MNTNTTVTTITLEGRGESIGERRARFDAPAIAAVRYADPASWVSAGAIANAITNAIAGAATREAIAAAHDRVGVIAVSAEGPIEAMAAMNEAARGGFSSPIRFPASNAGSLAGISAIAFGFRGPTLMITLPGDRGAPVALLLASAWIERKMADHVAVVCCARADRKPVARAIVLGSAGEPITGDPIDREREAAWLAELPAAAHEAG